MRLWPFKKKPAVQRDINQLIFDVAEHGRPEDQQEVIAALMDTELFAPVVSGAPNLPSGTRYVTGPSDNIQLTNVRLGDLWCVLFYTDRSDPRLKHPCVSMSGREAMEAVLKANADGIAIQNNRSSYFGLRAEGIREALGSSGPT